MWRTFLTPRWLGFHALVVAGVVFMTWLGFWQLNRLDERREFNTTVTARTQQSPLPLSDALAQAQAGTDVEWVTVFAQGRWLIDEQVLVINRSQGGVAGRNVVTPFETDDGTVIAISRGFIALTQDPPPPPGDTARVRGLLRPSEPRGFGGVSDPATGRLEELQRLDLDRLAVQLPPDVAARLASWSLSLEVSDPAQPASLAPVPRPELSEGPHLSYAGQWFVFAICVAIGWVVAMRRSITSRRRIPPVANPVAGPASGPVAAATTDAGIPPTSPD
jgi:cytochrome oxidase assembly protein ShyY1